LTELQKRVEALELELDNEKAEKIMLQKQVQLLGDSISKVKNIKIKKDS